MGRLRLNVPGVVARFVLPDIVARFLTLYPDVTLDVATNDAFVDVIGEGFDAGVRYEEALQPDMIAIPIGPKTQSYIGAAAPSYLARFGPPEHPRDLLQHQCILHRFSSGRVLPWSFAEEGREFTILPPARVIGETSDLEVAMAVAGHGIIFTFAEFLADAVTRGHLVPVLERWSQSFSGPFLYYNSRRHMPAPLKAFIDFVKTENRRGP